MTWQIEITSLASTLSGADGHCSGCGTTAAMNAWDTSYDFAKIALRRLESKLKRADQLADAVDAWINDDLDNPGPMMQALYTYQKNEP